jgi:ribose transport system permease protein
MMTKTTWGRNVYSIGCNKRAAEVSGINVKKIQISVFVLNGFISAFVGILYIARLNAAEPVLGTAFALQSIGSVVLGGISLRGGKGSILNAVVGAILITMINNGLTLMGVSSYWQSFVFGSVIIVAIIIEIITSYLEKRVVGVN